MADLLDVSTQKKEIDELKSEMHLNIVHSQRLRPDEPRHIHISMTNARDVRRFHPHLTKNTDGAN